MCAVLQEGDAAAVLRPDLLEAAVPQRAHPAVWEHMRAGGVRPGEPADNPLLFTAGVHAAAHDVAPEE